jgi:hypothetical protein
LKYMVSSCIMCHNYMFLLWSIWVYLLA